MGTPYRYREYTHQEVILGANSMDEAKQRWAEQSKKLPHKGCIDLVRISVFVSVDWFKQNYGKSWVDEYVGMKGKATYVAYYNIHHYKDVSLAPETDSSEEEPPLPELPTPFSKFIES